MINLFRSRDLVTVGLIIVITIMIVTNISNCNKRRDIERRYENTILALNDSLKKIVNSKGDTVFIQTAAEMTPRDIMNSVLYKTLDKKTREYLKELSETKGLLASAKADISVKDSIIKANSYNSETTTVTDSTVIFKKGSSVGFSEKGKNLTANVKLSFLDSLKWSFDYEYKVGITTTWRREKDKSIMIEYKLDDPEAQVVNGKAFYIPVDEQKSKLNKALKTITWIAIPTVSFIGGGYIGYKLAK